jgi:hypothetical protein
MFVGIHVAPSFGRLFIFVSIFVRALETGRKASLWRAFLSRFAASGNTIYINRQYMYIVFILQYQTAPKTSVSLSA